MTNNTTPNLVPSGASAGDLPDGRQTRRPVKLVEHPTFRDRRRRAVPAANVGDLGAIRVVSLTVARADRGSSFPTISILEAA